MMARSISSSVKEIKKEWSSGEKPKANTCAPSNGSAVGGCKWHSFAMVQRRWFTGRE